MEFLKSNDQPADLNDPVMLFAFSGWADAGEAATHGLRYLIRHLKGTKFAEIDPEEFYNFTRARPHTKFDDAGERYIKWPANEFFAVKHEGGGQDLVVFIGVEPNLRWRTFCESMLEVVRDLGVTKVIQVGALFDAVPHTRETRVTGTVGAPEQKSLLRGIEVRRSRYTGPTGISGVLADTLRRAGLPVISLWGHSPHYLQVSPNPKVSLRLLECLGQLTDIHLDVEPLRSQGANFERRVEQALSDEPEVIAYVEKLEVQWDSKRRRQRGGLTSGSEPGVDDMPDPGQAVEGIEEFLRQARQQEGDSTESRE